MVFNVVNPLNTKFNLIHHLLTLLGAHHILRFSRVTVKLLKDSIENDQAFRL